MKTIVSFEMLVFCFALKHTINSAAPTGKMDVPWNKQKNPKLEKSTFSKFPEMRQNILLMSPL